ncbi:MAG TPA: thiamine phosphate synthase [Planctomycetaceae bacterium]|nr:thiamine phosphate synthase [Planctomycetaceae bacterium]HBP82184.1 thiamine phosphate synthase [Planctomycetaceae bacterium]
MASRKGESSEMEEIESEKDDSGVGIWRTLDASANRSAEAVRVLEDILRFCLDDAFLSQEAKAIRHELAIIFSREDLQARIRLRDVLRDVGVSTTVAKTPPRTEIKHVVAANAARASQSIRSLEECSRLVVPAVTTAFEQLRYRIYTLEKAAMTTIISENRLADISLCVLLDVDRPKTEFKTLVGQLLAAGVNMIQLRDKKANTSLLCERTKTITQQARQYAESTTGKRRCIVLVNDRADVAVAANADGVHLGETDLPVNLARKVCGHEFIIGRTAHSIAEAKQAVLDGADYLGVGPCYPSNTKQFKEFATDTFLRDVSEEIRLPVFAIGGITSDNLDRLVRLGVKRVAIASSITDAADPGEESRLICSLLSATQGNQSQETASVSEQQIVQFASPQTANSRSK